LTATPERPSFAPMPQPIVVDIVVSVLGALIWAFGPPKADRLGSWLFFAGALAALLAQR
jgi:hypothetical protein